MVEARAPVAEEEVVEVVGERGEEEPAVGGFVSGGEAGSEKGPVDWAKDIGRLAVDK